jgi:prevent-host-death family protein
MKTMSAREAKNAFGLMIDTARAEPVLIEKHGRGVVMVISVEEHERLHGADGAFHVAIREIALIQEFRTRLIADVVTGKLDVCATAASLPEIIELEPIDESADGEDLDETILETENEEAAA